jgi:thiopurine S-methyltransferase
MDAEFWLDKWEKNQLAFHEGTPNALLVAHFAELGIPAGGTIFVPLCGKTNDMLWVRAQGYRVVGAELSRLAVEQFFAENGLAPTVTKTGCFERFESEGITLLLGDLFELDDSTLGPVDAIYDRAALVALPPAMRLRYAAYLIALTNGAPQFLVIFEYDQSLMDAPPHSVTEAEVRKHYGAQYQLDLIETRDVEGGLKGVCPATESAWLVRRPL